MKYTGCEKCGKIVVPILFAGNLLLAITKTGIGIIGNSSGLIADGAHSATDALSSVILYIGLHFSERPADSEHPYGHRNIEFIIAKIISICLLLVGLYILFSSVYSMIKGTYEVPDYITLFTAALSILANGLMYLYGTCVGSQINSPAILTNAYENKADAMSSTAILIGIIGAELGYPALDPIAACIVSLIIIRSSIHMLSSAMNGLMDASIDEKIKQKIIILITRTPDVKGIKFLRTRWAGRYISIEAGINLDSTKNVKEADTIIREIRGDLMNLIENIGEVQITISSMNEATIDEEILDDLEFQPAS